MHSPKKERKKERNRNLGSSSMEASRPGPSSSDSINGWEVVGLTRRFFLTISPQTLGHRDLDRRQAPILQRDPWEGLHAHAGVKARGLEKFRGGNLESIYKRMGGCKREEGLGAVGELANDGDGRQDFFRNRPSWLRIPSWTSGKPSYKSNTSILPSMIQVPKGTRRCSTEAH